MRFQESPDLGWGVRERFFKKSFWGELILNCTTHHDSCANLSFSSPLDINVHSYYYSKDQLRLQDQRFKNRTSLFKNEISGGNASLRLTKVEVKDRGKYKCYTSTSLGNKDSFIDVEVEGKKKWNAKNTSKVLFNCCLTLTHIWEKECSYKAVWKVMDEISLWSRNLIWYLLCC